MTDLRYPIGQFSYDGSLSEDQKQRSLDSISRAPANLRDAVRGLSDPQLNTPYRPDGWTVCQVAHHVHESHLHAYVRFVLALTEREFKIKPNAEKPGAELTDMQLTPVEVSLELLESLHDRWLRLLRSLRPTDWKCIFRHPEMGLMSLEKHVALYAWHGRHHVAHIRSLRERNGW